MEVIIITQNEKFITVLDKHTDLNKWAKTWIENDDQDIEFWQRGNISIDKNNNEINISGDNGLIILDFKIHNI